MRQAPEFQNWVMSRMVAAVNEAGFVFSNSSIRYIYDHTSQGSLLRKLTVDGFRHRSHMRHQRFTYGNKEYRSYPQDFLEELLAAVLGANVAWSGRPTLLIKECYMFAVPARSIE